MKNGALSRSSVASMNSATSCGVLDRIEQQQEFVAADPRQHIGFAQVASEPSCKFDQKRVADRMAIVVVDVLEIIDVEKGEREFPAAVAAPQQAVGAVLDHPPRRQVGQFIVIGGAEQLIFEGLLLTDIGRARNQQRPFGDANQPMGREQNPPGRSGADGFLGYGDLAGAEQFERGFAAQVQLLRSRCGGTFGNPELGCGGIVHQHKAAVFVLNRDAGRQHPEHISQKRELGFGRVPVAGIRRAAPQVVYGLALHTLECAGFPLSFG